MNKNDIAKKARIYESEINLLLKTGKIHINNDGKIKKSITLGRDPQTGKMRRIQAEGHDVKSCALSLAEKEYRFFYEDAHSHISRTFEEVANEWFENTIKHDEMSDGNRKNYRSDLDNNIFPHIGKAYVSDIKSSYLQNFINLFEGMGESKVKKIRMTVLRVTEYAMLNEYMPERMIKVKLPRVEKMKERNRFYGKDISLLKKVAEKYIPAKQMLLLIGTGLRPSEAFRVKFSDFDANKGKLTVRKSKTENGKRVIPLCEYCKSIIAWEEKYLSDNNLHSEYIFFQQTDPTKAQTSSSFYVNFNTIIRNMDIANGAKVIRNRIIDSTFDKMRLAPDSGRHTYCSLLEKFGASEYLTKRLMGHSLKDNITNNYRQFNADDICKMSVDFLNYLDRVFENPEIFD